MPKRLSFQLYSARDNPIADTLSMLARIGYREVEGFGGCYGDPMAMRVLLDENGLAMPTGHFSIEMLENERSRVVEIAETLGLRHFYAPYIAAEQRPKTAAGWRKLGKRLAAIGAWARAEGYGFGWHNHDFEFARLPDGSVPLDVMFGAAPLIDWEIDVAWVARAKINPLPWIKKHAGRITAAHVKDIAPKGKGLDEDGWADVGAGTMDWPRLFKALGETRALHYVVEHDKPKDVGRFAKRSFAFASR